MRTIAIICVLFAPWRCLAATYYVNATGGDDSRTTAVASSPATPWLTLTGAEAKAANGDTVNVAAGAYVENDASVHCLSSSKAITWVGAGAGSVMVTANASGTKVVNFPNTSTSASFIGFTFDAAAAKASVVVNAAQNKSFDHCTFTGATSSCFNLTTTSDATTIANCSIIHTGSANAILQSGGSVTFTGNTVSTTNSATSPFWTNNGTGTGTLTVTGNSFTHTGTASSSSFFIFTTACTITISSNTFIYGSTFNRTSIELRDQTSPQITYNTIDESACTSALLPISVSSTGTSAPTPNVSFNTIYSKSPSSSYVIRVGGDGSTAGDNKVNGATIIGNVIYGPIFYDNTISNNTVHGILYGSNTNGIVSRNYINGCGYGIVIKHQGVAWTSGSLNRNIIVNCVGAGASTAGMRIKGTQNLPIYNNTIYVGTGLSGTAIPWSITENGVGEEASGAKFTNNATYAQAAAVFTMDTGASNNFACDYNLWYSTAGAPTFSVTDAGSSKTLSQWQAFGYDAHSLAADPKLTSSTSYLPLWTSPLINAGVSVGFTTDFAVNPIVGTPDIGAYEYQAKAIPLRLGNLTISIR